MNNKTIKWKVSYGMWKHGVVEAVCNVSAMKAALEFFGAPVDKCYLVKVVPDYS